jgi:hypothetical protein
MMLAFAATAIFTGPLFLRSDWRGRYAMLSQGLQERGELRRRPKPHVRLRSLRHEVALGLDDIVEVEDDEMLYEDRTPMHGYEPTREAAMQAFAKSWHRG